MIPVLSREQVRQLDALAMGARGMPGIVLMENAGRSAAEVIASSAGEGGIEGRRVVIVCGSGNNGGDGFVVARHLTILGATVSVFLLASSAKLQGDARTAMEAWTRLGEDVVELPGDADLGPLEEALGTADVVVDALFGTGLDRAVEGRMRWVVRLVNGSGALRVALDVPSGIDANTGTVLGCAVEADVTVTFAATKLGLVTPRGAEHCGQVVVADIGVPDSLADEVGWSAEATEPMDVVAELAPRGPRTHKGDGGRVLVLAGRAGTVGAALLVARGALRAGAGLVWLASLPDVVAAFEARVLEVMTARIHPKKIEHSLDALLAGKDAVVVGPGLGVDSVARRIVEHVTTRWPGPKVIDADAISLLAGAPDVVRRLSGDCMLTPHPGELGRLLGTTAEEVEADRFAAVRRAVELTGKVVLLKGAFTLVGAPDEPIVVNPTGGPALATAGSGDVLAGVLGALACQCPPRVAAYCAAFVHGIAGDRWQERVEADRGMLAREIADELPAALGALVELARKSLTLPD